MVDQRLRAPILILRRREYSRLFGICPRKEYQAPKRSAYGSSSSLHNVWPDEHGKTANQASALPNQKQASECLCGIMFVVAGIGEKESPR